MNMDISCSSKNKRKACNNPTDLMWSSESSSNSNVIYVVSEKKHQTCRMYLIPPILDVKDFCLLKNSNQIVKNEYTCRQVSKLFI